jgi:hypothetical protein
MRYVGPGTENPVLVWFRGSSLRGDGMNRHDRRYRPSSSAVATIMATLASLRVSIPP